MNLKLKIATIEVGVTPNYNNRKSKVKFLQIFFPILMANSMLIGLVIDLNSSIAFPLVHRGRDLTTD